jgi:hypothetical protein
VGGQRGAARVHQIREPAITGTIITKVPFSVEALLGPYRVLEV